MHRVHVSVINVMYQNGNVNCISCHNLILYLNVFHCSPDISVFGEIMSGSMTDNFPVGWLLQHRPGPERVGHRVQTKRREKPDKTKHRNI